MESELAANQEQITQLNSEITTYQEQIAQLESELATNQELIAQLEARLERGNLTESEQITQLENELATKIEQIAQLESELATKTEKITQLESELATKTEKIAELEGELANKFNQISLLELEILAKSDVIAQLESELATKTAELNELLEQLSRESLDDSEQVALLKKQLNDYSEQIALLEQESSDKSDEIARLNIQIRKLENKLSEKIPGISLPSFINLSGEEAYSFEIGEATLSDEFKRFLIDEIADQIASHAYEYGANIIEVIGHTDEQPISRGSSNFDNEILDALEGSFPVGDLKPADNAGLGIARAVSVIKVLESIDKLSDLTFVPLSGGQLIVPDDGILRGNLSGDVKERRRIEIRVRRSSDPNFAGN